MIIEILTECTMYMVGHAHLECARRDEDDSTSVAGIGAAALAAVADLVL